MFPQGVSDNIKNGIKNIAEITEDNGDDTDSTPDDNITPQDDEDYDIVIPREFDLALRKFISSTNDTELTGENDRTPKIYLDTLRNGTFNRDGETEYTATYEHTKEPILLKAGNPIVYTIRIYNEGEMDGYATEITDYLDENLEFVPYTPGDESINDTYGWKSWNKGE